MAEMYIVNKEITMTLPWRVVMPVSGCVTFAQTLLCDHIYVCKAIEYVSLSINVHILCIVNKTALNNSSNTDTCNWYHPCCQCIKSLHYTFELLFLSLSLYHL